MEKGKYSTNINNDRSVSAFFSNLKYIEVHIKASHCDVRDVNVVIKKEIIEKFLTREQLLF
jgi:hypothetical protein